MVHRDAPKETSKTSTAAVVTNSSGTSPRMEKVKKLMKARGIRGCYGCLQFEHSFEEAFKNCPRQCAFCKIEFRSNKDRHYAVECRKLPESRADIVDAVKALKAKQSKQR